MTSKVKSWTSKCLSYAGRLVLVKSILFSIQVYWSTHFILPKKVSKVIEQTLKRFLWSGSELKKWGSKVAWNEICKPKKEGGLGICKLEEWNKASMLRHIWSLCSGSSSLWVEWCKTNLLKGRCLWEIKIPSDCSWTWRKLLKLREEASRMSRYKVGKGDSISLWFSNWHPIGPLIPKYGPRVAYDAGMSKEAKVSQVIRDGQWKWPYPCTWELKEIILENPPNYLPSMQARDELRWIVSKDGRYKTTPTWEAIREKKPKVPWHKLVWFSCHIPKHSFILWLAIKERLNTKERMLAWGLNMDPTCVLCGQSLETIDHLFFKCSLSAELRAIVLGRCLISKACQTWRNEITWAMGKFSGKNFASTLRKVAWTALVYHIWKERNTRIFKGLSSSTMAIIQEITYEVKVKLSKFPVKVHTVENTNLCTNWGILL